MTTLEIKLSILSCTQCTDMDTLEEIYSWLMKEVKLEEDKESKVSHLTPVN